MPNYYPGQKNWDNRAHVAQARDLSSMHAPMFGLRGCLNFFGQGSTYATHARTPVRAAQSFLVRVVLQHMPFILLFLGYAQNYSRFSFQNVVNVFEIVFFLWSS